MIHSTTVFTAILFIALFFMSFFSAPDVCKTFSNRLLTSEPSNRGKTTEQLREETRKHRRHSKNSNDFGFQTYIPAFSSN